MALVIWNISSLAFPKTGLSFSSATISRVAAVVFAPTFAQLTPPAGIVLSYVAAVPLETATDTEHDPLAGAVAPLSETLPPPAAAVTVPPHVVTPGGGVYVPLDIARILDEIPPHLFPEQFASEARRLSGGPVALYVLDIDGTQLLRLAGPEDFPERIEAPLCTRP